MHIKYGYASVAGTLTVLPYCPIGAVNRSMALIRLQGHRRGSRVVDGQTGNKNIVTELRPTCGLFVAGLKP
jgi:hypothetical protein